MKKKEHIIINEIRKNLVIFVFNMKAPNKN